MVLVGHFGSFDRNSDCDQNHFGSGSVLNPCDFAIGQGRIIANDPGNLESRPDEVSKIWRLVRPLPAVQEPGFSDRRCPYS